LLVLEGNNTIEAAHHVPVWVIALPTVMFVLGTGGAWYCYIHRPEVPGIIVGYYGEIYRFLLNKWYFDELYDWAFVRPAMKLGRVLWKGGDGAIIDGFGPDGISALTRRLAGRAGRMQSGYVYHYAFAMMIGVVAIISWYLMAHGG
jgi:NADH-quinone oxidoreductase subunit L